MKRSNGNKYIEEAKKYYQIALDEIAEARKNGGIEHAVGGCDKGWLALNLALKAMFVQKGVKEKELPKTYRGTRYLVIKYGDKQTWNLFDSARNVLHIDGFWDRDPVFERVEVVLKDVKEFIETIENRM